MPHSQHEWLVTLIIEIGVLYAKLYNLALL